MVAGTFTGKMIRAILGVEIHARPIRNKQRLVDIEKLIEKNT